jgi:hypothetical protein
MKKRILTGHVERISLSGEVKCGGVVVKLRRISQDVSLENTRQKMITKTIHSHRKRKTGKGSECCVTQDVFVVGK